MKKSTKKTTGLRELRIEAACLFVMTDDEEQFELDKMLNSIL